MGYDVADSVILLERGNDGKFSLRDTIPLESFRNTVPVFGDRIALLIDGAGTSIVEVVERYFLDYIEEATNNELLVWLLIVKEVEPDYRDDLDESLMEIYKADLRLWLSVEPSRVTHPTETLADLDRTNRDPAYWTFERKEMLRKEREQRLASTKDKETGKK
ncbi:hypothetical protein LB557_01985 [Mesorhizobium sp. BR115XR7A]|uniref:hypothetical protein n=1 Tax=Mesorhizobium sp. BR115XR7A TaxID=2876645 RepID=UPI001CCC2F84|nr:hypothetical protein [Mesorhizobium sp. BR115XR7A]MBZ9904777.1 hypothetical protein [Mesorhizobium sp. BR115XR7A]MBZ9933040.1 hypothetical protein [Mesorhizobium sp. BR1-1-5]